MGEGEEKIMKQLLCVLVFLVCSIMMGGCVDTHNFPPIMGKINSETTTNLQDGSKVKTQVAIFLDEKTKKEVIKKAPEGNMGSYYEGDVDRPSSDPISAAMTMNRTLHKFPIMFGESFTGILLDAGVLMFSAFKPVDEAVCPKGYVLVKIYTENVDLGFEFSASESRKPALDKARISMTVVTTIIDENNNELSRFKMLLDENRSESLGITNQMAPFENCLNKIVVKYLERLSKVVEKVTK
jgi:hypothetical protein